LGDAGYLDANVNATYTDKTWLSAEFLEQQRADAVTLWNASLTYYSTNEKFSATAYVNNIDDQESYGTSTAHFNVYQLVGLSTGAPRTYGLRLRYNF
jgi:iron complex outermembrane receptor protein